MTRAAVSYTSTYIQGSVDYSVSTSSSGITVNVTFQMRRTNSYSGSTYSSSAVPSICVSGDSSNFNYSGGAGITVSGGKQNVWQTVYSASRTFSVDRSGNTIYVGWKVTNDNSGYLGGSAVEAITLPNAYTAPSNLTIYASPLPSHPTDSIEVTWGAGSFGYPSSGTVYLYGGTSASPSTQFLTKTTTGNSIFVHNEPLVPNTKYYYRVRACNSQLCSSYSSDATAITNPIPPTITVDSVSHDSVTFTLGQSSQGNARILNALYSIDGGEYIPIGKYTLPHTITVNFLPGTTHTIAAIFRATALIDSAQATVTVTTTAPLYGSVSGESKAINKLYGSVNGETKLVEHLYGSVPKTILQSVTGEIQSGGAGNVTAFDGETFYDALGSVGKTEYEAIVESGVPLDHMVYTADNGSWSATVYLSDNPNGIVVGGSNHIISNPATLGLTISYTQDGDDIIDLTGTYDTEYFTKLIY